jgi:SpoVK/Ycf46/Vps4 family AAA+-type ATPase
VAEQLGRPLVTGRASDVLNMYVGGTEQRIRALFAEARAQGAVLLLDEIDGLLRTRDRAERSWELTQVNELLVQIEAFPGVLIACTNLLETLDPAALRRFDLKVRFDCLRPAQAWGLVERILADRGVVLDADAVRARARIEQIGVLTPGDFAAVLRRFRFSGEVLTATSLVEALVHECDYKAEKPRRGIGFVADL